ncbi:MAG: AAA family ATPase [Clostridia bacterium]|nr:AAA family ATPase [Clostridia bacterium]
MPDTKTFTFAGKGGVGKTSLSAAFIRILSERFPEKRILAVDADPAVGLSVALDVQPSMTIDDVRLRIAESIEKGETSAAAQLLSEARFHLMDCIVERGNISFLAIGRPEAAGCYCKVNAYLKQIIETLSGNFDFVVIDGEAGIEQINRRVMENVTYLVLVTDPSKKGFQVVQTIRQVAQRLVSCEETGVIVNRAPESFTTDVPDLLAVIGEDRFQSKNDMDGESVFSLSDASPLFLGAKSALEKLLGEDTENAAV